jgi:hypothetical protein
MTLGPTVYCYDCMQEIGPDDQVVVAAEQVRTRNEQGDDLVLDWARKYWHREEWDTKAHPGFVEKGRGFRRDLVP